MNEKVIEERKLKEYKSELKEYKSEHREYKSEVFDKVLKSFGISTHSKIDVITNGTANKNYLVKVESETSSTVLYVIRERSPKYSSREQILFEEEYLHHIYSKGIPVPVPLKNIYGECWYYYDEKVYQMYPFIGGGKFNCDSDVDVEESGRFLGRLHSAVIDFVPKNNRDLPRYDDPAVFISEIRRVTKDEITAAWINDEEKDILNYILEQAEKLMTDFKDETYHSLPKLYIHGDYHPANVKYLNGTICGLFDFDWVSCQPRIRDVTDGIIYFSSRRSTNVEGSDIFSLATGYNPDLERSRKFLKAYSENVSMPLTKDELKHIPFFMKARLIYSRVQALPKIPKEMAVKMLTVGMRDVLSWIDENMASYKFL
ncbi:MAG TPA: phosphotransferase [Clostridiaceae bacterium]|nr:phosphotransferase [Clostridiaceae bacterium]